MDNGQLAREMESDRVAASRAMAQNRQLKQQLQELQDGFITLVRTCGRCAICVDEVPPCLYSNRYDVL